MLKAIKTEYSTLMSVLTESKPVEEVKEESLSARHYQNPSGKGQSRGLHLESSKIGFG